MTEVTYVKPAKDDYIKKIKNGVKSVTTKFKSTRKESLPSPIEKSLENLQSLLKKENMAQQIQSDVCSGSSPSLEQHNGQIYQKPDEADKSSAESLSVEDRIKEMSIGISARPMSPHFQRLNEVDERQSSPELVENRTAEFSTVSSSTQTSYQEQALKDKYLRLYDNASKEAVEIKLRCQTLEQLQNNYVAKRDHVIKKSKYNTNGGYKFDGEQPLSEYVTVYTFKRKELTILYHLIDLGWTDIWNASLTT